MCEPWKIVLAAGIKRCFAGWLLASKLVAALVVGGSFADDFLDYFVAANWTSYTVRPAKLDNLIQALLFASKFCGDPQKIHGLSLVPGTKPMNEPNH